MAPRSNAQLRRAIVSGTRTGEDSLDAQLVSFVKRSVRDGGDDAAAAAFHQTWAQLQTAHGQVRFLALHLCRYLVPRSVLFRSRLLPRLPALVQLLADETLLPRDWAARVRDEAARTLAEWSETVWGKRCKEMAAARLYIEAAGGAAAHVRPTQAEAQRRAAEDRARVRLLAGVDDMLAKESETRAEWASCIAQLDTCFDILFPSVEELAARRAAEAAEADEADEADDDNAYPLDEDAAFETMPFTSAATARLAVDDVDANKSRQTADAGGGTHVDPIVRPDLEVVRTTVLEFGRLLTQTLLPRVKKWQTILVEVDIETLAETKRQPARLLLRWTVDAVRRGSDMQDRVARMKAIEQAAAVPDEDDEETFGSDEEGFEDVPFEKEGYQDSLAAPATTTTSSSSSQTAAQRLAAVDLPPAWMDLVAEDEDSEEEESASLRRGKGKGKGKRKGAKDAGKGKGKRKSKLIPLKKVDPKAKMRARFARLSAKLAHDDREERRFVNQFSSYWVNEEKGRI